MKFLDQNALLIWFEDLVDFSLLGPKQCSNPPVHPRNKKIVFIYMNIFNFKIFYLISCRLSVFLTHKPFTFTNSSVKKQSVFKNVKLYFLHLEFVLSHNKFHTNTYLCYTDVYASRRYINSFTSGSTIELRAFQTVIHTV